MEIRPLEFSIVIVASDCNPTIVNPDFLARQLIVPEKWGWKVSGPAITTPPFATVSYDSGVNISVEPNKFQVVDRLTNNDPNKSHIPSIAQRYIEVLPHVRYTAVGHNFKGFLESSDAEAFLKHRFLKAGVWDSKEHPLTGLGLKLSYLLEDARLNLSLDGATIVDESNNESKKIQGVLVQANYHRDCSDYPSNQQVIAHLGHTKDDWDYFRTNVSEILK